MRGMHGVAPRQEHHEVASSRDEADAASRAKSANVRAQFAAMLDSARGGGAASGANANAKAHADGDDANENPSDGAKGGDAGGGDASTRGGGGKKGKDANGTSAVDAQLAALVLPFAPPTSAPALPTKLSLDAAANGEMSSAAGGDPSAKLALPAKTEAANAAAASDAGDLPGAATGADAAGASATGAADSVDVAHVGQGDGATAAATAGHGANAKVSAGAATVAMATAPALEGASASDLAKRANGQTAPTASAPADAAPGASTARRAADASVMRAGDLDPSGGTPAASAAAHASSSKNGDAGGGGKDPSKSDETADATRAVTTTSAADLGAAVASASRDNSLTGANPLAAGTPATANPVPDGPTTAERAASAQSAANQMVMRNAAHGEIDHPELGRIGVSADLRGGNVDVRISAERPDATATLTAHAVHMASDVRAADIPLSQLHIQSDARGGNSGNHASSGGAAADASDASGQGASDRGAASGTATAGDDADVQTSILQNAVDAARVRIVL